MSATAIPLGVLLLLAGCGVQRHPQPRTDYGRIQFQNYCAACHRYDGQQMGEAPPLETSSWVRGPEDRLIRIVLHGLRGRLEMPGFGPVLSDAGAASLLSYVRARFAPAAAPVTAEAVNRVRARYQGRTAHWTAAELLTP